MFSLQFSKINHKRFCEFSKFILKHAKGNKLQIANYANKGFSFLFSLKSALFFGNNEVTKCKRVNNFHFSIYSTIKFFLNYGALSFHDIRGLKGIWSQKSARTYMLYFDTINTMCILIFLKTVDTFRKLCFCLIFSC